MSGRVKCVLLVATLVAAAVTMGLLIPDSDTIRVGVVYNTTGGMKWLDRPGLEGVRLAVEEINASGGVLGRTVEIVEVDGTTDVTKTVDLVADLATVADLAAIIGVNDPIHAMAPIRAALRRADGGLITFSHSEIALAVGRVTAEAGVPFVTAGSTLSGLSRLIPGLYMVAADHRAGAEAIADYALGDLGRQSVFILLDSGHEYTNDLAESFERRWLEGGGSVAGTGSYSAGDLEISPQIRQVEELAGPPDVIFIASLPNDGGYLARQLRAADLSQPILFADVVDPRYIFAMAGDMDGIHMSTHGALSDPDSDIQEFNDAYENAYGHAPGSVSALLGYDTMRLIADAITRAGSVEMHEVSQSLSDTRAFDALTGSLWYATGSGSSVKPITIVSYEDGQALIAAEIKPP